VNVKGRSHRFSNLGAVDISDSALFDEGPEEHFAFSAECLSDLSDPDRYDAHDGLVARRATRRRRFLSVLRDSFEHFGFDSPVYPISEQ
jgi:hypothetical protein